MIRFALFAAVLCVSAVFAQPPAAAPAAPAVPPAALTATPSRLTLHASGTTSVAVKLGTALVKWDDYNIAVQQGTSASTDVRYGTAGDGILELQAPLNIPDSAKYVRYTVTVTAKQTPVGASAPPSVTVTVDVTGDLKVDWEARAIVGWHQAGASSAPFTQNVFFDFFVMRPIGKGRRVYDNKFNLWGDVRIASAPQQLTIPLSQFAAEFASTIGNLKVNELALSGEFLTGFEIQAKKFSSANKVRTLGAVAFFGANGAFSDPVTRGAVLKIPGFNTPQWNNFVSQFPGFARTSATAPTSDPNLASAQYIGLVPPDRERFYRQYGGGIRYTAFEKRAQYAAPEMFTATLGQDQMITRGRYVGPVLKIDAFYPLPLSVKGNDWRFIYLFGTVNLAVAKPLDRTPLALVACSAPAMCDGKSVPVSDNSVAVFAIPSARDTYRMGVGIDFVALMKRFGVN